MLDLYFSSLVFLKKAGINSALKRRIFYMNLFPRSNFSFLLPVMFLGALYYRAIYFLFISLSVCKAFIITAPVQTGHFSSFALSVLDIISVKTVQPSSIWQKLKVLM